MLLPPLSLCSELSSMGCLLKVLASFSLCHFVYSLFLQGLTVTGAVLWQFKDTAAEVRGSETHSRAAENAATPQCGSHKFPM